MDAKSAFACVIGVLAAVRAFALDVKLSPTGDIRFGDGNEHVFRSLVALPGWQGVSSKGGWEIKKPGVAPFSLANGTNMLLKAEARLEQLPEGKVKIAYSFTPVEDVQLVVLGCSFAQPAAPVTGQPWKTPRRAGTFHHPAKGGISVMREKGTEITVALGGAGRMLTFKADREQDIAIQDNHMWGASYSLRLGTLAQRTWRKDETQTYAFTVSADEPLVAKSMMPTVIARGADWIPLKYRKEIEAGSALDFSHMGFTDAPAGKYGWMKNVGSHFEFEGRPGKPVRLYGVNLCGTANFPSHDEAEMMVTRFKRLGYNAIRLHHHDSGTVTGSADGLTLNAENMDKFDYLLATAIREGFYLTTDLFVSRNHVIKWRHIGVDRDGLVEMHVFKALCALYDPAFENWCAYAQNFLTHVNLYTGRAYKDEPALPLISLINEGGLFTGWGRETAKDERVLAAWKKWMLEKRAADPAFCPDADPDNPPTSIYAASFALFMGEVEAKMVARMKAFLRSIGCKALLTNDNCGPHHAPLQRATAEYDYIDDHFYVYHPHFLEQPWHLPSWCSNLNPILMSGLAPCRHAFTRMVDKPFTVTEWSFSGPSMFRGVGGILTGAIAALQDWDGMWRFAYAHSRTDVLENPNHAPTYFNLGTDPLGQASDRASICLFLRGDIAPLAKERGVSLLITPASVKPEGSRAFPAPPSWNDAAWNMRVSSCLAPPGRRLSQSDVTSTNWESRHLGGGIRVIPREQAEDVSVTNWARSVSANPSLGFDRVRGSFTIDTPRTCGGFAPDGAFRAGAISVTLGGAAATVWASSLDGAPVAASRRILVTHLTDVQGEGAKYADPEKTTLLAFGKGSLVRNGTARIALALAEPGSYTVYELDTSGKRLGTIPAEVRDGKLCFTAAVDGPHGARMLYEVVRRDFILQRMRTRSSFGCMHNHDAVY